jgi:hypothetical protein
MESSPFLTYSHVFWVAVYLVCVFVANRIIRSKSYDAAVESPIIKTAAAFWQNSLVEQVSSLKADAFGQILRSKLARSYVKHCDYPSIGIGSLLPSALRLGAEDLVFSSAVEAGIVARTPAGRERLKQMVPNGRMQIAYHSVVFISEESKIQRLWSAPGF